MSCEVRKSCSLRNVVYEIARLNAPVGVILVDVTNLKTTELFKSPRDRFWNELNTVFRGMAERVYEPTLDEDVTRHVNSDNDFAPLVLEIKPTQILLEKPHFALPRRLRNLGVRRIALIYIVRDISGLGGIDERILSRMKLREDSAIINGVDVVAIIDDNIR